MVANTLEGGPSCLPGYIPAVRPPGKQRDRGPGVLRDKKGKKSQPWLKKLDGLAVKSQPLQARLPLLTCEERPQWVEETSTLYQFGPEKVYGGRNGLARFNKPGLGLKEVSSILFFVKILPPFPPLPPSPPFLHNSHTLLTNLYPS